MKIIICLFAFTLTSQVYALNFSNSFEGALRSNSAIISQESYQAGVRGKQELGAQVFFISNLKFTDQFSLRTGAGLVMRDSKVEFEDYDSLPGLQSVTIMVSRMFLDIPLTLNYKISNFEVFGGINVANKLSSSIEVSPSIVGTTNNNIVDEKSLVTVPTFGFNYFTSTTSKVGLFYEFDQNFSKNWNQTSIGLSAGMSL